MLLAQSREGGEEAEREGRGAVALTPLLLLLLLLKAGGGGGCAPSAAVGAGGLEVAGRELGLGARRRGIGGGAPNVPSPGPAPPKKPPASKLHVAERCALEEKMGRGLLMSVQAFSCTSRRSRANTRPHREQGLRAAPYALGLRAPAAALAPRGRTWPLKGGRGIRTRVSSRRGRAAHRST